MKQEKDQTIQEASKQSMLALLALLTLFATAFADGRDKQEHSVTNLLLPFVAHIQPLSPLYLSLIQRQESPLATPSLDTHLFK